MKNTLLLLLFFLMIYTGINAQEQLMVKTKYLAQSDPVLVFKPDGYNAEKSYPLVYLLHGYSENYLQWSKTTDVQTMANKYQMIIVCPDGFVSYYLNSPKDAKSQYEDFFFKDLVPLIHHSFNIDKKNIFISGLSMGGYGALRYFILYPDYFNTAGSTSGALYPDFPFYQQVSRQFWSTDRLTEDLKSLIGDPEKNSWAVYSIVSLLKMHPEFKRPFIFDCGTEDILYENTIQLKSVVDRLKIPATFLSQPGDHNTEYWRKSIEHHFVYFKQNLIAAGTDY